MSSREGLAKIKVICFIFLLCAGILPHLPLNSSSRSLHPFFNFKLFAQSMKPVPSIYKVFVLNCENNLNQAYPVDLFSEARFLTGEKKYRFFRRFEALFQILNQNEYRKASEVLQNIVSESQIGFRGCSMAIFRGVKKDTTKSWIDSEKSWEIIDETTFKIQ